ncbi:gliding motility lipoprotein GldB [Flavobacteriaceae bacterium 3-367]|uniref:gliding motility lipoprotein GldB n=1 Tax=Eudoraea algarum TaxID=3417568 RepID=UPI00327DCCE1
MKRKGDYFHWRKWDFLVLMLTAVLFGCGDGDKVAEAVRKTAVDLEISRFDRAFAQASPSDLPALKNRYPYLFPEQYADSVWEAKLVDTLQLELLEEVDRAFANFEAETADLELLFKHIKYYFPNYKLPKVLTVTTDVDYNNRVILTDSLLFLGLDNYLGHEHKFYAGMQNYIAAGLDKRFLISDVAGTFGKQVVSRPRDKTLLSKMVYYGKELYLKDKIAPFLDDTEKIGYSSDQLAWAQANEEQIWRYFVERELLYSTNNKLDQRFLDLAPFSKFQLELDNESPGRIGRYMGWQIVRSFMENNDLNLTQLLNLSADEIFKRSNYKPKK